MKLKKCLLILIFVIMLFSLTACSNNEETVTTESDEVSTNDAEELEIDGTGKIVLKEFVESPKLATKQWFEATTKDLKSFYNVDENDNYNSKTIDGIEFDSHFSNNGSATTIIDGVAVTTKNEHYNITDRISDITIFSKDVLAEEEFPEELELNSLEFSILLKHSDYPEEVLSETFNNTVYHFPYIKEHNCKNIEDFAIALGFEETDKSMLYAIKNNIEYYADYESDYGNISVAYFPGEESDSTKTLEFSFEDETSWLKSIIINSMADMSGDTKIEELKINFTKKFEE